MRDKEDYSNIKYAVKDEPPKLSERKQWFGTYKGVRYEINNFSLGESSDFKNSWTHYIILNLDEQLEKEIADKFWLAPSYREWSPGGREHLSYDYYDSIISNLEFHGGCTFYQKETRADEHPRVVKIGCDYQHLWDQNNNYDLEYVFQETKNTIDSLISLVGEVKIRSWGDGKYRKLSEFTTTNKEQQ